MRTPTNDDYQWLYANTDYMHDGLKNARPFLLDITERCPSTFIDWGCGRGDVVRWINDKTKGWAMGFDPVLSNSNPSIVQWLLCFDVLEHIAEGDIYKTLKEMSAYW